MGKPLESAVEQAEAAIRFLDEIRTTYLPETLLDAVSSEWLIAEGSVASEVYEIVPKPIPAELRKRAIKVEDVHRMLAAAEDALCLEFAATQNSALYLAAKQLTAIPRWLAENASDLYLFILPVLASAFSSVGDYAGSKAVEGILKLRVEYLRAQDPIDFAALGVAERDLYVIQLRLEEVENLVVGALAAAVEVLASSVYGYLFAMVAGAAAYSAAMAPITAAAITSSSAIEDKLLPQGAGRYRRRKRAAK